MRAKRRLFWLNREKNRAGFCDRSLRAQPGAGLAGGTLLRDQAITSLNASNTCSIRESPTLAKEADGFVTDQQHERPAATLLAGGDNGGGDKCLFDDRMRTNWPNALVTCAVTTQGEILSPQPNASPAAALFYADFGKFLGNRESAQVYWNASKASPYGAVHPPYATIFRRKTHRLANSVMSRKARDKNSQPTKELQAQNSLRNVMPQQGEQSVPVLQNFSKVASSETEFRQLVGDADEGTIARFVDNKLRVLLCDVRCTRPTSSSARNSRCRASRKTLGRLSKDWTPR